MKSPLRFPITLKRLVLSTSLLTFLAAALVLVSGYLALPIPVTEIHDDPELVLETAPQTTLDILPLPSFIESVQNGRARQVVGVYSPAGLALPVVQQPSTNPGYVSSKPQVVTQFGLASYYGGLGFLAHNSLPAGEAFYQLRIGDAVFVVRGDGSTTEYRIAATETYQALSPDSPYSRFVRLDGSNAVISATALFMRLYDGSDRVVFQTCMRMGDQWSWGRYFVIAVPAG